MKDIYLDLIESVENIQRLREYLFLEQYDDITGINENTEVKERIIYEINKSNNDRMNNKLSIIQKLKISLTKDNKKILDKYKEKALKNNPIGLTIKDYYIFKSDIESKRDKAIKLFDWNIEKLSDSEIKKIINDDANQNHLNKIGKVFEISRIGTGGMFNKKNNYKITKKDITDSIKILENINNEYSKFEKEWNNSVKEYRKSIAKKDDQFSGNKKRANSIKKAYIQISINTYYEVKIAQLKKMQRQARTILAMAANHNPRNIKESAYATDLVREFVENDFDTNY